jgi:hypothetical protein
MRDLNDEELTVVEFVKGCGWGFDEYETNHPRNESPTLYFRRNGRYIALGFDGSNVRIIFRKSFTNERLFDGCLGDPDCLDKIGVVLRDMRMPRLRS